MYQLLLIVHSALRWAVIVFGAWAVLRAVAGLNGHHAWTPSDAATGRWFVMSLDVQFLVGVLIYGFLSPFTTAALGNMGDAMRDPELRFWAVEHPVMMLAALGLAHVGKVRIGRAAGDRARHVTAATFFTLALLLILVATPWPMRAVGRQLLRPLF